MHDIKIKILMSESIGAIPILAVLVVPRMSLLDLVVNQKESLFTSFYMLWVDGTNRVDLIETSLSLLT